MKIEFTAYQNHKKGQVEIKLEERIHRGEITLLSNVLDNLLPEEIQQWKRRFTSDPQGEKVTSGHIQVRRPDEKKNFGTNVGTKIQEAKIISKE